ncbi:MAG: hypothetical protein IPJ22_14385 [Bacteroidetes bacterium]|nr:hypothetical protein [Bacteroidota bacterium]
MILVEIILESPIASNVVGKNYRWCLLVYNPIFSTNLAGLDTYFIVYLKAESEGLRYVWIQDPGFHGYLELLLLKTKLLTLMIIQFVLILLKLKMV